MKSIVMLVNNYYPETNAAAKRNTATAEYLAERGWQVSVVTLLPHHPQNKIYEGFNLSTPFFHRENNVEIIRLKPWIVPKNNLALRLISEAKFSMQAFRFAIKLDRDIIFASSPYMFLGPAGLLAARLKRKPFVWDIRDLTWLYPKASGKKTYGLDKILDILMRFTAKKADVLTTATNGLLQYFKKRPKLSSVIPNGVTDDILTKTAPLCDEPIFNKERPHVVYAGLFGYAQGLMTLIETAKLLPNIDFTLVGDGPERADLISAAAGMGNVRFEPYLQFSDLLNVYKEADILVGLLRKSYVYAWAHPSKLWEYMSTGRPVIYAGEGDVVHILEKNKIALTVPPEDPEALARAILELIRLPKDAIEMGIRGRKFVENERRRNVILSHFEELLNSVLKNRN